MNANKSDKYFKDLAFFKCPFCGDLRDFVSLKNGLIECNMCNEKYDPTEENREIIKTTIIACSCGEDVPLTPSNKTFNDDYLCPNCETVLTTNFKGKLIEIEIISNPAWLKEELNEVKFINDFFGVIECDHSNFNNEKLFKAFNFFHNNVTLKERNGFLSFTSDQELLIFLEYDENNQPKSYIGYITWSNDQNDGIKILRQIWVFKDKRNKKFGTLMMKYWIKNYAVVIKPSFRIERPKIKVIKIIKNLGYEKNMEMV